MLQVFIKPFQISFKNSCNFSLEASKMLYSLPKMEFQVVATLIQIFKAVTDRDGKYALPSGAMGCMW